MLIFVVSKNMLIVNNKFEDIAVYEVSKHFILVN